MSYLEILRSISGEKISTVSEWENFRKPEIIRLFSDYVYGVRPRKELLDLDFQVEVADRNYHGENIVHKIITISLGNFSFTVKEFLPAGQKNVPVFVYIMHEYQESNSNFDKEINCQYVPVLDIVKRGYGVIVMPTRLIYPDWKHNANYKEGIFKYFDSERRDNYSWASISAWAWGASCVMDYIEAGGAEIDKSRVAVLGHSRSGKAALWCGATDERFSYVISNNSGCAGAAMHRGKEGEHIKDINISDWFCGNYRKFNDNEYLLPVDQHMLLAAIAPRLLYIASSEQDTWADPKAERSSCRLASEVYTLYERKGAELDNEPIGVNEAYHEGNIGYHMKAGEHSITPYDWKMFLNFADKKWKLG